MISSRRIKGSVRGGRIVLRDKRRPGRGQIFRLQQMLDLGSLGRDRIVAWKAREAQDGVTRRRTRRLLNRGGADRGGGQVAG